MFIKTSAVAAKEYFEIVTQPFSEDGFFNYLEVIKNKEVSNLMGYDSDIYVEDLSGLTTIFVTADPETPPLPFVLQNLIKIRKGLYFNFAANSFQPTIKVYIPHKALYEIVKLKKNLATWSITSDFTIREIFAVFYLSKNADYQAELNTHYYYELTYLESGSLEAIIENDSYSLIDNDLILVGPDQKHRYNARSKVTMLSLMFAMDCPNNTNIVSRCFHCDSTIKDILQQIYHYSDVQNRFYCEMLINYVKSLITMMLYYNQEKQPTTRLLPKQIFEDETFNEIINYIQNNIYTSINIPEICKKFGISRSSLQNLFKNNLNTTPKYYINKEKLELSRQLLRQRWKTVSEIADILDYSSVHYFSRAFKKHFGLNPSEYAAQK